jgi:iron complex outermembrane receptor protein
VSPFVRGRLTTSYNHNTRGADGTLSAEGAHGGLGARGAVTVRGSGDMRTPSGVLANTRNRALATEGALGYRGGWGQVTARYTGRSERIEIFDDPATSPGYSGYQPIDTHRGTVELTGPAGRIGRLQLNAGYEQNFRQEFDDAGAPEPALGLFVRNWTGFAHLHHAPLGPLTGTLGVSGMTSHFENRGTETLIPDSDTRNVAVYAFEEAELGRWRWTVGARYDYRSLSTGGNVEIGVPSQTRRFHAVTGSVGTLYRVTEPVALVLNVARGFRAPAAPDLFANGFHEGTRAFERGDPNLKVETSLNTDLGVRVSAARLTAEATGFVNRISNYIYLRPFGATAFDSLQVVQGNALLWGLEARAAYRPVDLLTLHGSADYVHGQNTTAGVPLTFIPPFRVIYGVRLDAPGTYGAVHGLYFTATGETNARQSRLDPRDVGPPGYTVANFGAGFTRTVPRGTLTVDLSLRNAFDVRYRSFMSRYKEFADAPGRALVLRVSTAL